MGFFPFESNWSFHSRIHFSVTPVFLSNFIRPFSPKSMFPSSVSATSHLFRFSGLPETNPWKYGAGNFIHIRLSDLLRVRSLVTFPWYTYTRCSLSRGTTFHNICETRQLPAIGILFWRRRNRLNVSYSYLPRAEIRVVDKNVTFPEVGVLLQLLEHLTFWSYRSRPPVPI